MIFSVSVKDAQHAIEWLHQNQHLQPLSVTHHTFPFQYIYANYFYYKDVNYLVIVDRYSNWPSVIRAQDGSDAKQLINIIKSHCEVFGIPEELSSDGGPKFSAFETRKFLTDWGIHHRISLTGFPHINCRSELGVKTVKRLITSNVGPNGSLNADLFRRAILQYKNTPDYDTKLAPAQIVPNKNKLANVWFLPPEHTGMALAKRHAKDRERP